MHANAVSFDLGDRTNCHTAAYSTPLLVGPGGPADVHPKQEQEKDELYRYGGWWVENAKYGVCSSPALSHPVMGPCINTFWDPIDVRPETGEINLIYEIDPAAKNLVFTDGRLSIDVDELLKRH